MMGEKLNAGDICNRIVVVAERTTTLFEAAQRMREQHVGCLVVVEPAGSARTVAGILTDRDIVTGVVAKGLDPKLLCIEDVLAGEVVTVRESDPYAEVLATMQAKGLRRLPVLGADGALAGLVTLDDLLDVMAGQMRAIVQTIATEQRHERSRRR
jgi:CBS domain-containing protein